MNDDSVIDGRGVSSGSRLTQFGATNQPSNRRGKASATIVKDAIFEATGGDLVAYWAWVVRESKKPDGAPFVRMVLDRVSPTLRPVSVPTPFEFPANGTTKERIEAVLLAVANGTLGLDVSVHILSMIEMIDRLNTGQGIGRPTQTLEDFDKLDRDIIDVP